MMGSNVFARRQSKATSHLTVEETVRRRKHAQGLVGLPSALAKVGDRERHARKRGMKLLKEDPKYLAASPEEKEISQRELYAKVAVKYDKQRDDKRREFAEVVDRSTRIATAAVDGYARQASDHEEDFADSDVDGSEDTDQALGKLVVDEVMQELYDEIAAAGADKDLEVSRTSYQSLIVGGGPTRGL
jgi:hypothetical protein